MAKIDTLNIQPQITVDDRAAAREINRLETLIGKSYDLSAAIWALQTLYNAYEKDFGKPYQTGTA